MSATRKLLAIAAGALLLAGCSSAEPTGQVSTAPSPAPAVVAPPAPTPTVPAADIVITFYGSDIQVIGSTYDDTPAVEDLGRVPDGYQVIVPPETGFSWGAVSWNGANDAGCRVTRGDEVLLDNTGAGQMSAQCMNMDGF